MAAAPKSIANRIPKKPRLTFCGELQSQQFTEGAFAVFDALARIGEDTSRFDGRAGVTEAVFAELQQRLLHSEGDAARGALAGIASYLAAIADGAEAEEFEDFQPLEQDLEFKPDRCEPPKQSLYFEVCGEPVSATQDHAAYRWDAKDAQPTSIELVRGLGRAISRKKFDRLRAQCAARKSEAR